MQRQGQAPDKSGKNQESNLVKLVNVLDTGFDFARPLFTPSPRSNTTKQRVVEEFKVPVKGPLTQTRIVGYPIDLGTARNLRNVILGYSSQSFTTDWKKFYFVFRDIKSKIPYGLDASSPGPRSLVLALQAYVMKSLMFSTEDNSTYFGKTSPTPSKVGQEAALVEAFVDIIWKASIPGNKQRNIEIPNDKRQVVVALVGQDVCFRTKGYFVEDGFTEKLWLYSIHSRQELKKFIRRNIHYFCSRFYPGAVMLLYSVVLSRTCDVIKKDMGKSQDALLTENARSTRALVNLVLTGIAAPHLHNGVQRVDNKGKPLSHPLNGIRGRSEVGFLFFDKKEHENKRTEVGSMLKTPLLPIWLTQVNGTHGLLFCTTRDLVTDWKTERYFCLHYFNGHFTQQNETLLTLDTRTRVDSIIDSDRQVTIWDDEEEIEKKQPSLELCLFTKWAGADIDWNGETPYY